MYMKKIKIASILIAVLFLAGITGCSLIRDILDKDPIRDMILATVPGTLAKATPGVNASTPEPDETGLAVLMADDFSDSSSGWEEYEDNYGWVGYRDDTYVVEAYQAKQYFWGLAGQNYSDIRIEVDATVLATNDDLNDSFGVDCRLQESSEGYGFRISSDGYALIELYANDEFVDLTEWVESDAIYTDGRTNHITAICQGNHLSLLVNDVAVVEAVDDTFAEGDIALSALSFTDQPISVAFDDIVVREMEGTYVTEETGDYSVTLSNTTDFEACSVYIVSSTSEFWEQNLLDTDETFGPGETRTFSNLSDSMVDIKAETCQNLPLLEYYEVDLTTTDSVELWNPQILAHKPFDDLTGWPSGVVEGGMISNTNSDYYSVVVSEADKLVSAAGEFAAPNVLVHADASLVKKGSEGMGIYGVTCRVQEDGSGILFAIRGDGMASIIKFKGNELTQLTDWVPSDYINSGVASNYIEGDCYDNTFSLFVNGDFIDTAEDDEFTDGRIGVAVFSPAGESTQADFDFVDTYLLE